MKMLSLIICMVVMLSCSSKPRPEVTQEQACSPLSLNYMKNPKNKNKTYLRSEAVINELNKTAPGLQACYDDFKKRSRHDEFTACLVVGVDNNRKTDFYHFHSNDKKVDEKFIACAVKVTSAIPYFNLGKNYIVIQTYNFYKE